MPKWILSARSRSSAKVNEITGADHDEVTVYCKEDLDRRKRAAKNDPRDLEVRVRKAR